MSICPNTGGIQNGFSSLEFLFLFLPTSVVLYHALNKYGYGRASISFLFLASLFYYGYWKPENTFIIIASIGINYAFGHWISGTKSWRKPLFILGISINLLALAYFKYTDFSISIINSFFQTTFPLAEILLPIGISFFTFQQIAYLADIYTKKHDPTNEGFINYCCFVCFFPQLVAGPIVHHQEMMPQFADPNNRRMDWENIYAGLVMLSIGLAKKVLIADNLSPIVTYTFDTAQSLTFLEACFASLAYTMQLYFDFSGYSDMAIRCALFFNIKLPQNFLSPYKATDIQEFWKRWHITLSRWLKDYLYIPLGGNRHGSARTLRNIFITFLLGGVWHGAAWTFILWGAMHGMALVLHRIWKDFFKLRMPSLLGWSITFLFINLAWIVFRVPDFEHLEKFINAFSNYNGFAFSEHFFGKIVDNMPQFFSSVKVRQLVLVAFLIAVIAPNSNTLIQHKNKRFFIYFIVLILVGSLVMLQFGSKQEFLYFDF